MIFSLAPFSSLRPLRPPRCILLSSSPRVPCGADRADRERTPRPLTPLPTPLLSVICIRRGGFFFLCSVLSAVCAPKDPEGLPQKKKRVSRSEEGRPRDHSVVGGDGGR